jgi:hypothetical protein
MPEPSLTRRSHAAEAKAAGRFASIRDAFFKEFGAEPELYARAPGGSGAPAGRALSSCQGHAAACCPAGRVNLIGEHIDYEGYDVLPMAIRAVGGAQGQGRCRCAPGCRGPGALQPAQVQP